MSNPLTPFSQNAQNFNAVVKSFDPRTFRVTFEIPGVTDGSPKYQTARANFGPTREIKVGDIIQVSRNSAMQNDNWTYIPQNDSWKGKDGEVSVGLFFGSNRVDITESGKITIDNGTSSIVLEGDTIKLKASKIEVESEEVSISGKLTVEGEFMNGSINLTSHTHPVDTPSGTTQAPQ